MINMRVSVPICSFRKPYAREYFETERVPPPSTVYGFLLSFIGEENRSAYIGTQIAIAIIRSPSVSTVLRTAWRIKSKNTPPGVGSNKRPDFKEILSGLEIAVWVKDSPLETKLKEAYTSYSNIQRHGALSLGESTDLVDEIQFFPQWKNTPAKWLFRDDMGHIPLPVWVDHVGSKGTRWVQLSLKEAPLEDPLQDDPRWITIQPPELKTE